MIVTWLPLTAVTQPTCPTLEEPATPGCMTMIERLRGSSLGGSSLTCGLDLDVLDDRRCGLGATLGSDLLRRGGVADLRQRSRRGRSRSVGRPDGGRGGGRRQGVGARRVGKGGDEATGGGHDGSGLHGRLSRITGEESEFVKGVVTARCTVAAADVL